MADLLVIGLGYVGLPLAQAAIRAGLSVAGLDVDEATVSGLNTGTSHVDDLGDDEIKEMLEAGFYATRDAAAIGDANTIVICVPTPLSPDGGPDLEAVVNAAHSISDKLSTGTLVVLESTTYPGTTEEVLQPILEQSGLRVGIDFSLAFSPERIDPGNPLYGITNTPKIVGGATKSCTDRAATFYGRLVQTVVRAKGTREAEMAKLLENTYRHVNIALVNEMAQFSKALDIDIWNVIECASSKPFGFQAFRPGPGVGGHCIPIDPNYLSHTVKSRLGHPFRFVELAQEINAGMPAYVGARIQDLLNEIGKPVKGARVLLLGVTYKADIADARESPARPLAAILRSKGARVEYHDPLVSRWSFDDTVLESVVDLMEAICASDITVLLQAHRGYDLASIAAEAPLLFDTRGITNAPDPHRL